MFGVLPVGVIGALGAGLWAVWDQLSFAGYRFSEEEIAIEAVQADTVTERATGFAAAFIDTPGDPMIIRLEESGAASTTTRLTAPLELETVRSLGGLVKVRDVMVSTEESFVTTLPSSQQDFAFFQALRSAPDQVVAVDVAASADATAEAQDASGGWGDEVGEDGTAPAAFRKTQIANTTSVAFVQPQDRRKPLVRDVFVRIAAERQLADLLRDRGFDETSAKEADAAVEQSFGITTLTPGMLVRMRGMPQGDTLRLAQIRLDDGETYFGSLARTSDDGFVEGTDPWYETELSDFTEERDVAVTEQKYRMLDAFYSTAIRNLVPSAVVGEAIALVSKSHDLDAFANPGDRMEIIFARERGEEDTGAGQILYVALGGSEVDIECFVFRSAPGGEYGCYGATPGSGGGAASGMVTPVKGVLTSRFGPRTHPILKTVRMHSGVDWAAPTGTPVFAAFGGTVAYAGNGGGYGNLIKLAHPGGFETRYAHLSKFGVASGATVAAGQVIGFVGTTGRSTGPHLHFELRQGATPIDPLTQAGVVNPSGTQPSTNDAAVETLVNQIIRVESAGNARAKNPLSTATGLGQFIESTWIRMMRTYRPDLVASLSRAELLELRFDPTISREMVRNLALEGESYLRARGHGITAGRLYLCHFLGAEGAHKVLQATDADSLRVVLGDGVIRANPFLKGRDVAYIKEWAERKMSGRRGRVVAAAPVVREPAGLKEFREMVKALRDPT